MSDSVFNLAANKPKDFSDTFSTKVSERVSHYRLRIQDQLKAQFFSKDPKIDFATVFSDQQDQVDNTAQESSCSELSDNFLEKLKK